MIVLKLDGQQDRPLLGTTRTKANSAWQHRPATRICGAAAAMGSHSFRASAFMRIVISA